MSRNSKRVCFSPDATDKSAAFFKHGGGDGGAAARLSAMGFLLRLGEKVMEGAMKVVSMRRKSSRKVSSSTMIRSRSLSAGSSDSHRAEAVEDCIEFLHSSSSRERPS